LRTAVGYGVVMVAAVAILLRIGSFGADLVAPAPALHQELFGQATETEKLGTLPHVLLAFAAVIIAARAVGVVFRCLGQPPVMGEVIAGILLGPSFFGRFWPEVSAYVLPTGVLPFINVIAQIGVILYMFLVGVELNPSLLRRNPNAVIAISHSSIVVPFLLGSMLSLLLYPIFATSDVPFGIFFLFMGISMSVTAFPVLARILTDRGMHRSRLGTVALTCAAVGDLTAWCLLAFVVSVAKADMDDAVRTLAWSLLFVAFMLLVVRSLMGAIARRAERQPEIGHGTMAAILVALLLSAFTAEWIGIHALFGAFILGALVPHDGALARHLTRRLHDVAVVFFLPAYFAFTGMRTQIGLVSGMEQWLVCALIIAVASLGKFGGIFIAGRVVGLRWREGAVLGILMNTRGLMELIVLNIGLDLKILSPTLFTMLVLMAITTTLATTPILDLLNRERGLLGNPETRESG
jgi:Kef-type K+ transport system membrane component KefB